MAFKIKRYPFNTKDWDCYMITNAFYGIILSISNNGYRTLARVTWTDFQTGKSKVFTRVKLFAKEAKRCPSNIQEGDLIFRDKGMELDFLNNGVQRQIKATIKNFQGEKVLVCQFILNNDTHLAMKLTSVAQGIEGRYDKQEVRGMQVTGYSRLNHQLYKFRPKDSHVIIDWHRGSMGEAYKDYTGIGKGTVEDKPIGFYLASTKARTKSVLYYNEERYLLSPVNSVCIKEDKTGKPAVYWVCQSLDHRINLTFIPILDKQVAIMKHPLKEGIERIFGKYEGQIKLKDGRIFMIKDVVGIMQIGHG